MQKPQKPKNSLMDSFKSLWNFNRHGDNFKDFFNERYLTDFEFIVDAIDRLRLENQLLLEYLNLEFKHVPYHMKIEKKKLEGVE